jgi:hypothetical protein
MATLSRLKMASCLCLAPVSSSSSSPSFAAALVHFESGEGCYEIRQDALASGTATDRGCACLPAMLCFAMLCYTVLYYCCACFYIMPSYSCLVLGRFGGRRRDERENKIEVNNAY